MQKFDTIVMVILFSLTTSNLETMKKPFDE